MRTLSRKCAHRKSLIRNLATSLVLYESVETTSAKAKELKTFIDTIIPRAMKADLNANRYLSSILFDSNAVKKVLKELVPRYANKNSGYVRIYKLGNRIGDNAPMSLVELVDKKVFVSNKPDDNKPTKKSDKIESKNTKKITPPKKK